MSPRLAVSLHHTLTLQNPILSASGTFGYGTEAARFFDPGRLGAILGKSISLEPREGNPAPRVWETPAGMLNSIGLQNPGIDRYLKTKHPELLQFGAPVIVNIAGKGIEEYEALLERLADVEGVAAVEANLSCPNVKEGGTAFCHEASLLKETVSRLRKKTEHPLFVKLSPNVTDISEMARIAEGEGANGLSLVNTFIGLAIDWRAGKSKLAGGTGGLSGPAIKPLALWQVHRAARVVDIPILGIGGIRSAEDVLDYIVAGATAVQVGTAAFRDPLVFETILAKLPALLEEEGIDDINDLRGTLEL